MIGRILPRGVNKVQYRHSVISHMDDGDVWKATDNEFAGTEDTPRSGALRKGLEGPNLFPDSRIHRFCDPVASLFQIEEEDVFEVALCLVSPFDMHRRHAEVGFTLR